MEEDIPLYTALKASTNDKKSLQELTDLGYVKQNDLSNANQQVYYNANKKKLLTNIRGTHNFSDAITDIYLGVGAIKSTTRYREAKRTFEKAKVRFPDAQRVVTGYSLGGGIANYIADSKTKVVNYNAGYSPGVLKNVTARKNVLNYRTKNDVVSTFAPKAVTLKNTNKSKDFLTAHKISNIKNSFIYV